MRTREQNRRDFPRAAAFVDAFAEFGAVLKYAEEGGRSIGKPTADCVPWGPQK